MQLIGLWGIVAVLAVVLPLAWKWQLGVMRVGIFVLATGAVCSVVAGVALTGMMVPPLFQEGIVATVTMLISTAFLAYRFYRDPERQPPEGNGIIVSPADGTVVYIKRSKEGCIPVSTKKNSHAPLEELLKTPFYTSGAWVVGISMNLLDVHVNRAPVTGTVSFTKHFPGPFGSLRVDERVLDNERATTIIKSGDFEIAIVQIASRLVRQIVSYIKPSQSVVIGQRIGAIRFGSQVDVVLPDLDHVQIMVKIGDQLKAGESILAHRGVGSRAGEE